MDNKIPKIQNTAERVRKKFEEKGIPKEELVELYSTYNRKVNGDTFIAEAERVFPKLNCGLATVYLQKILGEGEIVRGKYQNENHTFLILEDNQIVDITADQYGGSRVYVGDLKPPWSLE